MANFYLYRIALTYSAGQPPVGGIGGVYPAGTRYSPQYSSDAGVSYRSIFPGDQPQSLLAAQQSLAAILVNENDFRNTITTTKLLGTLTDFIAYP